MEEISLHLLDIAENSVRADAKKIEINLTRDVKHDVLRIQVNDDGNGMDPETLTHVRDPFFTTKKKKTGLGIPLLAQAAELTGGSLAIDSAPGKGTRMEVVFGWSHIDRPSIGSMTDTLLTLIAGHPDIDIVYQEQDGSRIFRFETHEIKKELEGVPINSAEMLVAIRGILREELTLR